MATISSDQRILDVIRGDTIDFIEKTTQRFAPSQYKCNPLEVNKFDEQINWFLDRGIIEKAMHSNGQFISNIFHTPKERWLSANYAESQTTE